MVYPIFSLRNERKKKKMKKHEKEKEFMKSLKAVSVTTSYCGTVGSESEESGDSANSEDELSEPDNYISNLTDSSDDDESSDEVTDSPSPLYFLYDCEGTGGSVYKDHISGDCCCSAASAWQCRNQHPINIPVSHQHL